MPLALQNYYTYYFFTCLFYYSQSTLLPKIHSWTLGAAYFSIYFMKKFYLTKPKRLNIIESLLFGYVIYDDDSMCTFIIRTSNGSEPFLTSSIPDLQLDNISLNCNGPLITKKVLEPEINSNSSKITFLE